MSAYTDAVNADKPAYYWRMSNPSGSAPEEKGGTAITLSGVTYGVAGPLTEGDEGAISFDGSNDYGQAAIDLTGTSILTIEYWLKWDVNGTNDDFALEYGPTANSTNGFNVDQNNSTGGVEANTVSFKTHTGSNDRRWTIARPSAAVWHHYVWVIDRSVNPQTLVCYVDGVAVTTTGRGSPNNASGAFSKDTLNVMARNKASLFGAGDMAHLAIYKVALTKSQVEAHYAARDDKAGPDPVDLEGDVTGASTLTGALDVASDLTTGHVAGQTTLAGALTAALLLGAGTVSGASNLDAALDVGLALAGHVVGSSDLDGALTVALNLGAADTAGASALTAQLKVIVPLSGHVAGASSVGGALDAPILLDGHVAGVSTIAAPAPDLALDLGTGDVEGSSTLTGHLGAGGEFAGHVQGSSTLTGNLDVTIALDGNVAGASNPAGALDALTRLTGHVAGETTLTGDLNAGRVSLGTGHVQGSSTITAAPPELPTDLTGGAVSGSSTLAGNLTLDTDTIVPLSGHVSGQTSIATADLTARSNLSGHVAGASTLTGAAHSRAPLSGHTAGSSSQTGSLGLAVPLTTGHVAGTSTLAGSLATRSVPFDITLSPSARPSHTLTLRHRPRAALSLDAYPDTDMEVTAT